MMFLDQPFSWLIAFLAQVNPLFGPEVKNALAAHMRKVWSGFNETSNALYPCKPSLLHARLVSRIYLCIGFPNW